MKIFSFLTVSWNINHTLLKTMLWPFCCSRAVYEWEHKLHAHASARGTDLHPVRSWQILKGCKFKPPFFEVWGKGNDCFNWHLILLTGVFICDCGFFFFFFLQVDEVDMLHCLHTLWYLSSDQNRPKFRLWLNECWIYT